MAMQVGKLIVGADVAKAELVIHHDERDEIVRLKNSKPEIRKWLKQQPLNTAIAVEATNVYHLDLVELAHRLGFEVYVIDGFQLSNYRK
ncbi:IS110 family transposase, partial [Pseudomonas inefficax]